MQTQDGRHPARDTGPESSNALARTGQTADRTPGREPWVQEPPHLSAVPEPFHIFESTADRRRVIAPCGELDLSNAAQLKERLAGTCDTVLDLSELSFIDSTGIHIVVSTAHRARSEAWEFTVRNPQPAVLRVIKLVGLAEHLGLESQTRPEEDAKQASPLT
jgi:anti-sigma B factor antagonist